MTLPIKILPTVEQWDCHNCGNCCRGSIIPLSAEDRAKLQAQRWDEHAELRGQATIVRESWLGKEYRLAQRDDGSCVFLMPNGLCRIHAEHGAAAKPLVCQMYPLQLVPIDDVAHLTLRRSCPSAAADQGRPLKDHLPNVKRLAKQGHLAAKGAAIPPLKRGEQRGWSLALSMLKSLRQLMSDERFPPVRRLVHGVVYCNLIEQAKTKSLDDQKLSELLTALEPLVPEEAAPVFAERKPPSAAGAVLFRQIGAEYIRLHPRSRPQGTWRERFQLVTAALSMVRGQGKLPRLHGDFPEATFTQLEQPLGRLSAEIYRPFDRYVETMASSYQYAMADRAGWSIVESFRALALTFPIGLWLLRWSSAGRDPTAPEAVEIVTALDRGQGYGPLAGSKQRSRLNMLARLGELENLVAWYAR